MTIPEHERISMSASAAQTERDTGSVTDESNVPALISVKRPITTVYYERKKVVKTTHAGRANRAVLNCVNHLQLNHYGASLAEIFDTVSGVLHAVIAYSVVGKITIIFKREVKEEY